MKTNLTIITPMLEDEETVTKWFEGNRLIFEKYPLFIYDSNLNAEATDKATLYIHSIRKFWEARRILLDHVETPFVLNLDADAILPVNFIDRALDSLREEKVGAVALDYEVLTGHLGFGSSLWKTELLKELYTWSGPSSRGRCECIYMWSKLIHAGFRVETLNMRAIHIKERRKEND